MRKPRDFDSELKALSQRAQQLKERKVLQLGALVIATGADALPVETLAGALLAAASEKDNAIQEGWRKSGASFFQRAKRGATGAGGDRTKAAANGGRAQPAGGEASAE